MTLLESLEQQINDGFTLEVLSPVGYHLPFELAIFKYKDKYRDVIGTNLVSLNGVKSMSFDTVEEALKYWSFNMAKEINTTALDPAMSDVRRYLCSWLS